MGPILNLLISFFDKQTDRQFYNYSDPAPFFLLISEQNLEAASFKSSSRMLEGNSLESDWISIFIDRLLVDIRVLRLVIRQFWEENALSAPTTCNVAFRYISQRKALWDRVSLKFATTKPLNSKGVKIVASLSSTFSSTSFEYWFLQVTCTFHQETPHVNQQNLRFFSWKDAWLTWNY